MAKPRLDLERAQILAFRRHVGALDERLPAGPTSLRRAAWAGLQDSVPRAALLSIHARVEGTEPTTWEDPSLVQLWGPRFSVYVVAARDRATFSLGRLPDQGAARRTAEDLADRLEAFLDGRTMTYSEAGHELGEQPNVLRYAAATGRVLMRWDGARKPTIWMVPAPQVEPRDARLELARRYLHILGPSTARAFSDWAGIAPRLGRVTFDALAGSVTPVQTPIGEAWILSEDEALFRTTRAGAAPARLLPSGDSYTLGRGSDRELLVPDAQRRRELWPASVWPGAVLVGADVVGTWRRAGRDVTITPWHRLSADACKAVEAEAHGLPVPGVQGQIRLGWDS